MTRTRSTTEQARIANSGRLLPQLVAAAKHNFTGAAEIQAAVLIAWTALAGVVGWTPGMVVAVEEEIAR